MGSYSSSGIYQARKARRVLNFNVLLIVLFITAVELFNRFFVLEKWKELLEQYGPVLQQIVREIASKYIR